MRCVASVLILLIAVPAVGQSDPPWAKECTALVGSAAGMNVSDASQRAQYPFTAGEASRAARLSYVTDQIQKCYARVTERQRAELDQHPEYTFDVAFRVLPKLATEFAECLQPVLGKVAASLSRDGETQAIRWTLPAPFRVVLARFEDGYYMTVDPFSISRRPIARQVHYPGCGPPFLGRLSVPIDDEGISLVEFWYRRPPLRGDATYRWIRVECSLESQSN